VHELHRLALECSQYLVHTALESAAAAAAGDEGARAESRAAIADSARALRDEAHAALHTGPWREVDAAWREAYMFAALHLAQAGRPAASRVKALELIGLLDLALMLGNGTYRQCALRLIRSIEQLELAHCDASAPAADVPARPLLLPAPLSEGELDKVLEEQCGLTRSRQALRRMERPSLERFFLGCMVVEQPACLEGLLDAWPAIGVRSWRDLAYWRRVAGHRLVPVEVGSDYLASDWQEMLMPLHVFLDTHLVPQLLADQQAREHTAPPERPAADRQGGASDERAPKRPRARAADTAATRETEEENADGHAQPSAQRPPVGYLAQHALLEQIPQLAQDIAVPDYCALSTEPQPGEDGDSEDGAATHGGAAAPGSSTQAAAASEGAKELAAVRINVWLGPRGTVSPLHYDPTHNLLAQVAGSKYVRLYPPHEGAKLYPHAEGLHKVSSQVVSLSRVDEERFPLFRSARYVDGYLRAGETLYIPPRWWHYVHALQPSCSVSFWWS
jgi:lysine-specific demethylase 8